MCTSVALVEEQAVAAAELVLARELVLVELAGGHVLGIHGEPPISSGLAVGQVGCTQWVRIRVEVIHVDDPM